MQKLFRTIRFYVTKFYYWYTAKPEILIQNTITASATVKRNLSTRKLEQTKRYLQNRISDYLQDFDPLYKFDLGEFFTIRGKTVILKRVYCDQFTSNKHPIRCTQGTTCPALIYNEIQKSIYHKIQVKN
jgi:hypothetical protein